MYTVKIKSIKKIGIQDTYDLHTPKYHNFVLDNGIVTHNSGKTFSGLTICSAVSKLFNTPFSVSGNVDFKFIPFLKKTMLPQNQEAGTAFLFEEVGAAGGGASSREWQSKTNRLFFSFMQTTRHRRQILVLTCPHFADLDAGARKLVHLQITMSGIDFATKTAYVKPYRLQVNDRTGKIYFKLFRFRINGVKHKLKLLAVKHPPEDIVKEYEVMKRQFTTDLNQSIIDSDKPDKDDIKKKVKSLLKKGTKIKEIIKKFPISERTLYTYKKDILN